MGGTKYEVNEMTDEEIYVKYEVELKFREKLLGGIPKNPEMIKGWLNAKVTKGELKVSEKEAEAMIAATAEEMNASTQENKSWTGFKSDDTGLYIEGRQVKAMMKECATTLKLMVKHRGLKQVLQHGTAIKPQRLYLGKKEPDGYEEGVCHTWRGSALKRNDFVERCTIEFEIWVVDTKILTEKLVNMLFELGQENGIGASRSQDFGKFHVIKLRKL